MSFAQFYIFFSLLGICSAFFKLERDEDGLIKWNDLRVTWGKEVTDKTFVRLPRTVNDALEQGFVKQSDCDVNAKWRGARYMQEHDPYVMLLFDINGFIAGMQSKGPKNENSSYPGVTVKQAFEIVDDMYILSIYFVDPASICTKGRTEKDFSNEGTGTNLYMQFGPNPDSDYLVVPRSQNDTSGTLWEQGRFFRSMGLHFWYNLSVDMGCDEIMPYFIMYNEFQLTGFGFGLPIRHPSPRYEHFPIQVLASSMSILPKCINDLDALSSLHVFLTDIESQPGAGYSTYLQAGHHLQVVSCILTLLMTFAGSLSF